MQHFDKISFYIVAHADDWQLFMHPAVYGDLIAPDCKVIFIIATAGDAGLNEHYWRAREEGSKSSVRFCLAPLAKLSESGGERNFNNHRIHYWSVNNTASYFLRLPDGGLNGKGFATCNYQSLSKFQSGETGALISLGKPTIYNSWSELVTVIQSIISVEGEGISNRWIHYLNPDTAINPNDHPDHLATGHAIQAMPIISSLHQLLFVAYSVGAIQENQSLTDLFWKVGMLAVYEKAVYDLCGYSTLKENTGLYLKWCCSSPKFLQVNASPEI